MLKKLYPTSPKVLSWRQIGKRKVPDSFFRGYSHSGCFSEEGFVTQEGFIFDLPKDTSRNDNYAEASINWNDDIFSLRILCNQRSEKKQDIQFKYGYSEMNLGEVLLAMKPFSQKGYFSFERNPLRNNPYHGNLLIDNSISNMTKRIIRDNLAGVANRNYNKHPDYTDL